MTGPSVGSLHVLRVFEEGENTVEVWSESGNMGDSWKQVSIAVGAQSNFYLFIEAHRGQRPDYACSLSHAAGH